MPHPKCRILGCPNAATEFPPIAAVGFTPSGESARMVGLCDTHYAQHQAEQLDMNRIRSAQSIN
jgi:hypothetical protein